MAVLKTVRTYPLDGVDIDFTIPYEYLARKFIVVTVISLTARQELVLNTDYRFSTDNQITLINPLGPSQGWLNIELRRYTSATARLVEFTDGSILKAGDLNIAQVQTMHIAEEARDAVVDQLSVNSDGHLDARNRRVINGADGILPTDFVTLRQLTSGTNSAQESADRAEDEADRAAAEAATATTKAAQASASATTVADQVYLLNGLYESVIRVNGGSLNGLTGPRANRALGFDSNGDPVAYVMDPESGASLSASLMGDDGAEYVGWKDLSAVGAEWRTQADYNKNRKYISDFAGWHGNGVDSDDVAWEAAVAWQAARTAAINPPIGGGFASAYMIAPAIVIPNGARVKLAGGNTAPVYVEADGYAAIECASTTLDILIKDGSYRTYFRNINFIGGKSQVWLRNYNVNFGLWLFDNCTFLCSSDTAVKLLNSSPGWGVTSTQAIFMNCRWARCKRAIETECDHSYVQGGWQQASGDFFDADTAWIKNTGLLTLAQILFVPGETFAARTRWMDNHGAIRCSQVRFGGEGGGIPICYHFAAPTRFIAGGTHESIEMGLSFFQCSLWGGNSSRPDRGVVVLQGQLVPILRVTDCTGMITAPFIVNNPADGGIYDIKAYIANLKATWLNDDMRVHFKYCYRGNKFNPGFPSSIAMWPADLDSYTFTDAGRFCPMMTRLSRSTAQAIPGSTLTPIQFVTTDTDKYDTVVSSTSIQVPTGCTTAEVIGKLVCASATAPAAPPYQNYTGRIYLNGVPTEGYTLQPFVVTGELRMTVTTGLIPVTAGQVIDLRFSHPAAVGVNVNINSASLNVIFR